MIVRMNAPSRASILAKQKAGILLVHQDRVKPFSRTSPKVSIDLANETENRLLKSGKDIAFTFLPILLQLFPHSSSRIKNVSSTLVPINYFLSKELCLLLHSLAYSTAVSS